MKILLRLPASSNISGVIEVGWICSVTMYSSWPYCNVCRAQHLASVEIFVPSSSLRCFLIGAIREAQQQDGRNAECHTNQFGNPPTPQPEQRCRDAACKTTRAAHPSNPPRTCFNSRRTKWIVLCPPPHRKQNPYAHPQRHDS